MQFGCNTVCLANCWRFKLNAVSPEHQTNMLTEKEMLS